jgi:hypothetical protein
MHTFLCQTIRLSILSKASRDGFAFLFKERRKMIFWRKEMPLRGGCSMHGMEAWE